MLTQVVDLLALCRVPGLSWHLVAREALRPGGVERLLDADPAEDSVDATKARAVLTEHLAEIDRHRDAVVSIIESTERDAIGLTSVLHDDYPLNLRTIFNPPPFLFYRGYLESNEDARSVAVVGTREASDVGLRRARKMATLLCEKDVTVLSGLARGIDTASHRGALDAGGRTVAVIGTGIRRVYPRENDRLSEEIAERGGAVVSQFWPDSPPATYSFPRRNITMSGMGQGTVVIEASSTSGAKLQGRLALQHGKQLFLIKSLVMHQDWAKKYSAKGAIVVESPDEVVIRLLDAEAIRRRAARRSQLLLDL